MYKRVNVCTALDYAKEHIKFLEKEDLICEEISDGNLNQVFRIKSKEDKHKSVILKQSLPTLRIDETMKLCLERIDIENKYLRDQGSLVPKFLPKVYHYDENMHLIIMEDFNEHIILRKELISGKKYEHLGKGIGEFLAKTTFYNSDLYLDPLKKKEKVKMYINPELCKITEELVFVNPYYNCPKNKIDPWLEPVVQELINDKKLQSEVAELREEFMTKAQSLIHGDLHTGSILINDIELKIIDGEFAFYGPIGFDIGAFWANIILSYESQNYHRSNLEERREMKEYLLNVIRDMWNVFQREFIKLWERYVSCPIIMNNIYMEKYILSIMQSSIGYAACKIIRRIYGLAPVIDITLIEEKEREEVQKKSINLARKLIMKRKELKHIDEFIDLIEERN